MSLIGSAAQYREVFGFPHLVGEFTFEIVTGLILFPIVKRAIRRHDRDHHPKPVARPNLRLVKSPPPTELYDMEEFG